MTLGDPPLPPPGRLAPRDACEPLISVVIAVYNGGPDLEQCIAAVDAQTWTRRECVLVDDGSTDGMAERVARAHDVRLIRSEQQQGPAAARNLGVEHAYGELVFFTDADVVLEPGVLSIAAEILSRDQRIAAVFGSYDAEPGHSAFLSQYRNLLHHWVHQNSSGDASSFWSGCGAVRRQVFEELGGFDSTYRRPSIEDIEFGIRIRRAGHAIRLERTMLCKHLKHWRFGNMVATDLFRRAIPWMALILRSRKFPTDLNLDTASRVATAVAGFIVLLAGCLAIAGAGSALLPAAVLLLIATGLALSPLPRMGARVDAAVLLGLIACLPLFLYSVYVTPLALLPASALAALVGARWGFYRFLCRERNLAFALAALPVQFVHFLCCAVAVPAGYWVHRR